MIHCLHGSAGCHSNWDLFQNSLGEEINAIDLWSFFDQEETVTLHDAGKRVADQATEGDLLLGYSMGGRMALHALLDRPEKWRGAIIIAANPGISEGRIDRIARDEEWAQLAESSWSEFLQQWNQQPLLTPPLDNFQQTQEKNARKVARSFRDWSLSRQDDLHPDLSKITCPVLWLTGSRDENFCRIAEKAIPLIPRGRSVTIPNVGHRLPWQQPDHFSKIVKDFVELSKPS